MSVHGCNTGIWQLSKERRDGQFKQGDSSTKDQARAGSLRSGAEPDLVALTRKNSS